MKVLVLGAAGMVGHVVTAYLGEQGSFSVTPVIHAQPFNERSVSLDLRDTVKLARFLDEHHFDAVVNCAGILNDRAEKDVPTALLINSLLPRFLEKRYAGTDTRVIHISTDCVFSGKKGAYKEDDFADGDTIYARTKKLGELNNGKDLTLRLSVVGPELRPEGTGLFNWFMAQKKEVSGFTRVFWTGLTTVELARQIVAILAERKNLTGLYHLVPDTKISKHDLLMLFKRSFRDRQVAISPDGAYISDKSLVDTRKELGTPISTYERMIDEMKMWVAVHRAWYLHYPDSTK
ncbi:MAG TPA: SDR family oxidoreductase [bacterium]|nr:SDR family oxidoreductase [bacterium]